MYEELRALIWTAPLRPFRVHLDSGEHYDVLQPGIAGMRKYYLIYNENGKARWIPYASIIRIERLELSETGNS